MIARHYPFKEGQTTSVCESVKVPSRRVSIEVQLNTSGTDPLLFLSAAA